MAYLELMYGSAILSMRCQSSKNFVKLQIIPGNLALLILSFSKRRIQLYCHSAVNVNENQSLRGCM